LLQPIDGTQKSLLEKEFPDKPSLVLAPELAFGTSDFGSVDALVRQYNQNLIFIGGFGFSGGSPLIALAEKPDIEGIWNNTPNPTKKYNGGWVWVKIGDSVKCYIFLKNYFEQNAEISLPHLTEGEYILRLECDDVVIFPLVCADLISKEDNSPSKRIVASLAEVSSANKKVLITGSLLNGKSESDHWKAAIGDLLEASKNSKTRLLLSNCVNPTPVPDEEVDRWRCLSGAYQHREQCKPPSRPLSFIRYVVDTKFSGLVLRNPEVGVVFGKLQWTNNSSQGLHSLQVRAQNIWNGSDFDHCDGVCAADELYRFVVRNKGSILNNQIVVNNAAKTLIGSELVKLLAELSPASSSPLRAIAGKLLQKCLKGLKAAPLLCPDQLYKQAGSLDCAITILKLLQYAVDAELMPEGIELEFGQLLFNDKEHEILIWDSSEHSAKELYNIAMENVVIESGSARPLTIVGRGNNAGMPPSDGRIIGIRSADFTNAPPDDSPDKDILEHGDRVVFWKNQGQIDEVLSSTDPDQDLIRCLRAEITVPGVL
jgi:hypothetical protein